MKKVVSYLSVAITLLTIVSTSISTYAASPNVQQPVSEPISTKPDVVITAFGGADMLDFVELYNQTSNPIELTGDQISFSVHDLTDVCPDHVFSITAPDGWLRAKSYFTFERGSATNNDSTEAYYLVPDTFLEGCDDPQISDIKFIPSNSDTQEVSLSPGTLIADNWASHKQRGKSSISVTGVFSNDYNLKTSDSAGLYSAPLYRPPNDTAGLEIEEILPHAAKCSPADPSPLCNDYVKLFNASDKSIDLTDYRLRTSYGGSKSSSSNTLSLKGILQAGQYKLVNKRDDGSPMSLTQSGGYVWLEDSLGAKIYQPVIAYPDASADSKIGQSWADDDSAWRWTMTPQPHGSNIFTLEILSKTFSKKKSSLKPCASDQVRNPITHRCRKIMSSTKSRVACKANQKRNPDTGRCRLISSASKTKKPCKPGQERNPGTGRCRKIQPKISNVKDIKTAAKTSSNNWYIIAAVVAGVAAYIFYEWRQELNGWVENMRFKFQQVLRLPRRQKT